MTDAGVPTPYLAGGTNRNLEKEMNEMKMTGNKKALINVDRKCLRRIMIKFLRESVNVFRIRGDAMVTRLDY